MIFFFISFLIYGSFTAFNKSNEATRVSYYQVDKRQTSIQYKFFYFMYINVHVNVSQQLTLYQGSTVYGKVRDGKDQLFQSMKFSTLYRLKWMVKWLNARGIMILIKCKHVNREVEGSRPADII